VTRKREDQAMSDRVFGIGIDLGTSTCAVSRVDISSGMPTFMEATDLGGDLQIPSVCYIREDGSLEFGMAARLRHNSPRDAARIVTNVKLLLRENKPLHIQGVEQPVEPKAIIRGLLAYLKHCFEHTAEMTCSRAVVTVPAYGEFDVDYRAAVRDAVMNPEPLFESIAVLPEPDAVLMSIGDLSAFDGETVLVFDMGAGTLDVTIREVSVVDGFPILLQKAIAGSSAAGSKITDALASIALAKRGRNQGFTYSKESLEAAKRMNHLGIDDAKRSLSGSVARGDLAKAAITLLCPDGRGTYSVDLDGDDFMNAVAPVVTEARETVDSALAKSKLVASDIDRYFMVGGSSALQPVKDMVREMFGDRDPNPLQGNFGSILPTLATARGAAIFDLEHDDLGIDSYRAPQIENRLPYSISLVTAAGDGASGEEGRRILVEEGTVLPHGWESHDFYVQRDGQTHLDVRLVRTASEDNQVVDLKPRSCELYEPGRRGSRIEFSWYVETTGELTVRAVDEVGREVDAWTLGTG